MSILYQSDKCVLISHENYINQLYKNTLSETTNKSYELNKNLFSINCPFKKHNLKRKLIAESNTKFVALKNEIKYIEAAYKLFNTKLHINKIINSAPEGNNEDAMEIAHELYTESGKISVPNTQGGNDSHIPILQKIDNFYLFPKNCKFYNKNVCDIGNVLKDLKYDLVILDPPWWNKAIRRKKHKTDNGYKMMTNDTILDIPLDNLLNNDTLVVFWCTNSPQNLDYLINNMLPKWGLKLIVKWFWLKITKSGEPIIQFSEPPSKLPFEKIIIASKNADLLINETNLKIIVSIPSSLHSHKPPLLELLKPYLPTDPKCIEIFARYLLPNCSSYGLEVLRFQNEIMYKQI